MADVKRLNYFTSQFLVEKDFKDEQAYFVGMRRRHNQFLHTWGVADGGLQVTKASDKIVTVGAGMAIDKDGQEIVLLDAQSKDLSGFGSNADVYLTIKYQEVSDPADHYTAGGVDNYTRTTERPLVDASTTVPASDGSVIVLTKVSLDGGGNIGKIDNTVRKSVGSVLDSTIDLMVRSLSVTRNASVGGNISIGTTTPENAEGWNKVFDILGSGHAKLSVRTAGIDARVLAHDAGFWGSPAGMVIGTKSAHPLSFGTNAAMRMSIDNAGKVGIGTASPDRSLTIANASGANYMNLKDGTREILMGVDGAGGIISVMSNHDLSFRAGSNNEKMRITAAGNVGIGTATPNHQFHVVAQDAVGLFESSGGQAYLRLSTNEGIGNRVEITNRPGGRLSLWTSGGGDVFNITKDGKVGIGTITPGFKLDVADRVRIRQGPSGTAGIWFYQTVPNAERAFVGMANDNEVGFWGNTGAAWGMTLDTTSSAIKMLASSNPLYFTRGWSGLPDPTTNVAEISNDIGTYKTLMIVGNKSAGLGRRVSVWDRFEINGAFVNNSSIEAKQDVHALSAEDYRDIHRKMMKTPLYRYRFKASGIDRKSRMGVISEESPQEILDETGKYVSMLDYVGFLFAALKAQAIEIDRLATLIGANVNSDNSIIDEQV